MQLETSYDRKEAMARVSYHLGQGVLAMLEAGRGLLEIRQNELNGDWLAILERLSIQPSLASRMMNAARKFLTEDGSVPAAVEAANGSIAKVYELALLDDEHLDAIEAGEQLTLDDVDRMSVTELRRHLRREREELRARNESAAEIARDKERDLGELRKQLIGKEAEARAAKETWLAGAPHAEEQLVELDAALNRARWSAEALAGDLEGAFERLAQIARSNPEAAGFDAVWEKLAAVTAELDALLTPLQAKLEWRPGSLVGRDDVAEAADAGEAD